MKFISLSAAVTLTGWSERTFWRRFTAGSMRYEVRDGRSMIPFEAIGRHIQLTLEADDFFIIEQADAGYADAQNDLAQIFFANANPRGAVHWLQLAVKQGHANAMQELGRCYAAGLGVPRDDNLALMWIARAAAAGHGIAQGQVAALCAHFVGAEPLP